MFRNEPGRLGYGLGKHASNRKKMSFRTRRIATEHHSRVGSLERDLVPLGGARNVAATLVSLPLPFLIALTSQSSVSTRDPVLCRICGVTHLRLKGKYRLTERNSGTWCNPAS
jgi:hypothetical protein